MGAFDDNNSSRSTSYASPPIHALLPSSHRITFKGCQARRSLPSGTQSGSDPHPSPLAMESLITPDLATTPSPPTHKLVA
ncbi:hypothetical protein E2C01_094217 [Portunus trituberculatus]|uniref:Uncharacterized protein n=1 Tax=Portunus trituberculatus TaxID=210409 RepID=A0A5B7JRV8_PORTR|nr:hypothetical protein [Portunus trituberculatus]